jgi:hypothetical protein
MKKQLLNLAGIALAICISINLSAQTVGTFTFSFTPVTMSLGYSGTKNVLAVWIQNSAGTFIKTKIRYVGGGTSDHLPTWAANSGGSATNALSASCNITDATTGATLQSFTVKTIVWDGKNVNGTSNGTTVADGAYKVTIQETWNHGTGGTVTTSFPFTKGPTADHQTPANTTNFTGIKLDWVPTSSASLTVATSAVNVKCNGVNSGSATATATGTAPYTYTWSTSPVQNTATATGLPAGSYTVTVKDANATTATSVVSVTQPTTLTSNVTSVDANCGSANGTASVSASGGTGSYTYLWSNGNATASINGLLAGIYSVTITDANGCTTTGNTNVNNAGAPTVNTTPTNASSCSASDGNVTSNVSGGTPPYTYLWSNSSANASITGVPAGNYTLTVTDATGCKQITVATVNCTSSTADAGVNSVGNPNGTMCASSFSAAVSLENFGSPLLTSCTINYYVDAPPASTFSWNGSLASGASVNVNLPAISGVSAGAHIFYSSTSNPNGTTDANSSNDQSQSSFNVSNTTTAIPLVEGFESGNLPSGWSLFNPDNDAAWQVVSAIAHTGAFSIGFNNCDGNGTVDMTGAKDRFITSAYDFTNATNTGGLSFDVAYAVLNYKNHLYTDTLTIFSSIDCSTTWNQVYLEGGTTLSGITTTASCWAPASSDWRTVNVNLGSLAGQSSVMFAFENRSDWGEWVYLDNININDQANGIASINSLAGFSIYPNPASTSFTIEGASNAEKIHYSIYNVVGAEIKSGDITATGNSFNGKIQISDISRGMYFIKLSDGENTWTKKLSVE